MRLLLVRHGRAEDPEEFAAAGRDDADRPLTADGIRRMKKAARGLRSLVPSIDLLVTSPLRRAVQTARIIADAYDGQRLIKRDELSAGADHHQFIDWLTRRHPRGVACLIGHEPDLSELLSLLLADKSERPAKVKKGSASLVRFDGPPAPARGTLEWYRPARKLASNA